MKLRRVRRALLSAMVAIVFPFGKMSTESDQAQAHIKRGVESLNDGETRDAHVDDTSNGCAVCCSGLISCNMHDRCNRCNGITRANRIFRLEQTDDGEGGRGGPHQLDS